MMIHYVKIMRRWYDRLRFGEKSYELRYNDRDYQVGDKLHFVVLDDQDGNKEYSVIPSFEIIHVLTSDTCKGLEYGFCILSLKRFEEEKKEEI